MLCVEGKVALSSFLVYSILCFVTFYYLSDDLLSPWYSNIPVCILPLASLQFLNFFPHDDVSKRAGIIGVAFGTASAVAVVSTEFLSASMYFICLAIFHISEYLLVALFNPKKLNLDSFLLNHSTEYTMAVIASWCEYLVEIYFFPEYKLFGIVSKIGLLVSLFGQVLRKAAMMTAEHNFTHLVQYEKASKHKLVKEGVYAFFRHPSYVGWFYWSVGSQLLLCNPICLIAYAVASWRFFHDRIPEEEYYLVQFFEDEYIDYMKTTPTGLPFIRGLEMDLAKLAKNK